MADSLCAVHLWATPLLPGGPDDLAGHTPGEVLRRPREGEKHVGVVARLALPAGLWVRSGCPVDVCVRLGLFGYGCGQIMSSRSSRYAADINLQVANDPHVLAIARVPANSRVLDLGVADGSVARVLQRMGFAGGELTTTPSPPRLQRRIARK